MQVVNEIFLKTRANTIKTKNANIIRFSNTERENEVGKRGVLYIFKRKDDNCRKV